jgi:hypothetical protein
MSHLQAARDIRQPTGRFPNRLLGVRATQDAQSLSLAHQYDQFSHLPGGSGPMGGSGALSCTECSRKPVSSPILGSRPHHDTPSSQQAPQSPAAARVRQPAGALPIPKARTGGQPSTGSERRHVLAASDRISRSKIRTSVSS